MTSEDDASSDPSQSWPDVHRAIQSTIDELGGSVYPKLNWSAPKDATWIAATNSIECRSPNDIYLLLKSSDFITHDLEHAFDGCEDEPEETDLPYHLVLRKTVPRFVNSMEFRCFVRRRQLIGVCQRDLNHYDFLIDLQPKLRSLIKQFFEKLSNFPDENFAFDVYIPSPYDRVWLIDINPWAQRTDPLLFSWLELLTIPDPSRIITSTRQNGDAGALPKNSSGVQSSPNDEELASASESDSSDDPSSSFVFRLVNRDDPEAYSFSTPQYSAHKLPSDVVEAADGGEGGLRAFIEQWRDIQAGQEAEESEDNV